METHETETKKWYKRSVNQRVRNGETEGREGKGSEKSQDEICVLPIPSDG